MKNAIITIVFSAVFSCGIFAVIDYALSIPDVKFSYSTNECVEVENYPTVLFGTSTYSCENLPSKFNHAWVQ